MADAGAGAAGRLAAVAPAAGSLVELLVLSASGLVVTAARVGTMNRWQHAPLIPVAISGGRATHWASMRWEIRGPD